MSTVGSSDGARFCRRLEDQLRLFEPLSPSSAIGAFESRCGIFQRSVRIRLTVFQTSISQDSSSPSGFLEGRGKLFLYGCLQ